MDQGTMSDENNIVGPDVVFPETSFKGLNHARSYTCFILVRSKHGCFADNLMGLIVERDSLRKGAPNVDSHPDQTVSHNVSTLSSAATLFRYAHMYCAIAGAAGCSWFSETYRQLTAH